MMTVAGTNDSSGTMPPAPGKKTRKPYQITRPREKWTADEHERFLHALHRFGRDWKRIEQFVATKTATQVATLIFRCMHCSCLNPEFHFECNRSSPARACVFQIRSHAQKYFIKAQKLGLAATLPPPHPRRGAVIAAHAACSGHPDDGNAVASMAAPMWPTTAAPPMNSTDFVAPSSSAQQNADDWAARASAGAHHHHWPSCGGGKPSGAQGNETIQLPLSPDDPRFALVYRFVGDVFGSGAGPVEAQLQRLRGVDPLVVDTVSARCLDWSLYYTLQILERFVLTRTVSLLLLMNNRSCWC
ncbi:hypothetical protein HU200_020550 [Digitaria exilis]|uniref:Uncharacterized protein n=1 Tax=Digitaria exilis TaxID=1010633 RepID=A0A835KDR4_9POAL|nr:hypothetical protein HU200_020550 [Digitaria exilis]